MIEGGSAGWHEDCYQGVWRLRKPVVPVCRPPVLRQTISRRDAHRGRSFVERYLPWLSQALPAATLFYPGSDEGTHLFRPHRRSSQAMASCCFYAVQKSIGDTSVQRAGGGPVLLPARSAVEAGRQDPLSLGL